MRAPASPAPTATPALTATATAELAGSTRHASVETVLGPLRVVRDEQGLTGIYFPGHWTRPDQTGFGPAVDLADDPVFAAAADQLTSYLAGGRESFELPMHLVGSESARRLWGLLQEIPYGATTTYGTLAAQLGGGISARAVGGYVGHNPLSIVVPCHRVVGSTGKLTGYAGGLARKQFLLELEGAVLPLV